MDCNLSGFERDWPCWRVGGSGQSCGHQVPGLGGLCWLPRYVPQQKQSWSEWFSVPAYPRLWWVSAAVTGRMVAENWLSGLLSCDYQGERPGLVILLGGQQMLGREHNTVAFYWHWFGFCMQLDTLRDILVQSVAVVRSAPFCAACSVYQRLSLRPGVQTGAA